MEVAYAMVHTPVPPQQVRNIPGAQKAVNAEWEKLEKRIAWEPDKVQPRAKVEQRAKDEGITIHFGALMALCHIKHSELAKIFQIYKGRIVFRGDDVKDEDGTHAVFSEQGTSANQMASTKFLDAIARLPGCDGEDADDYLRPI